MANTFACRADKKLFQLKCKVIICNSDSEIEVVALWDTGAQCTCISHEAADQLGLCPITMKPLSGATGSGIRPVYEVDILLPNKVLVPSCKVAEVDIGKDGLGLLIGMDIISCGDFLIQNYKDKTTFSFRVPPEPIDDFAEWDEKKLLRKKMHGKGKKKK